MKTKFFSTLIALAFLAIAAPALKAADFISVAVLDFESKDEAVKDLGPKAATLINAQLSAQPDLVMVERAEIEKLLSEQELGLSGAVSPDTAAKVGHLTGAKILVTGRVFRVEKEMIIVAKVMGTETSRVFGEIVKGKPAAPITDLSESLATKIAATIAQKADALVPKVETREAVVSKIKSALKKEGLPKVSVKINERHFGQAVIDPAAETEIGKLLQECGFTLEDDASKEKADVEISGEAFSAYGMRKGNLISCRSRIEIKARKASGEIISVDRETSVGVDISEQTAAKTALQQAALQLAERLLPKIAQ
jgi:RNA-binding protein YhbY